mgnify:CR=1 FL=1
MVPQAGFGDLLYGTYSDLGLGLLWFAKIG